MLDVGVKFVENGKLDKIFKKKQREMKKKKKKLIFQ